MSVLKDPTCVILKNDEGDRMLPIWVGPFEAQAIAMKRENVAPPRPMTHDLLDSAIKLAPGVRLTQESVQDGDHWRVAASHLRRTEGFEYAGGIDAQGAALLARCDGRTPLRDLVVGLPVDPDIDRADVARGVAGIIRELMERGFVVPGPAPTER